MSNKTENLEQITSIAEAIRSLSSCNSCEPLLDPGVVMKGKWLHIFHLVSGWASPRDAHSTKSWMSYWRHWKPVDVHCAVHLTIVDCLASYLYEPTNHSSFWWNIWLDNFSQLVGMTVVVLRNCMLSGMKHEVLLLELLHYLSKTNYLGILLYEHLEFH